MSISQLLAPNNYSLYLGDLPLQRVDFTITSAQILAGTVVSVLSLPAGQIPAIVACEAHYHYGTVAYAGAGLITLTSTALAQTILNNADMVNVRDTVSWSPNVTALQNGDALTVGGIVVAATGGLTTGNGTVSGTVYYHTLVAN